VDIEIIMAKKPRGGQPQVQEMQQEEEKG